MLKFPFITPVKGVSFYQNNVSEVSQGSDCIVVHEPFNEFDENACAVFVNDTKLGYVPKNLASRLVSTGDSWVGVVKEVFGNENFKGLSIEVMSTSENFKQESYLLKNQKVSTTATKPLPEVGSLNLKVYSKSGRLLGSLVSSAAVDLLKIEDEDGDCFMFPKNLADISA